MYVRVSSPYSFRCFHMLRWNTSRLSPFENLSFSPELTAATKKSAPGTYIPAHASIHFFFICEIPVVANFMRRRVVTATSWRDCCVILHRPPQMKTGKNPASFGIYPTTAQEYPECLQDEACPRSLHKTTY